MTVFEVRAAVDSDIDAIEEALAALKRDELIAVENGKDDRVVILVADRVVPDPEADPPEEQSIMEALRDKFGL